ncbi:putative nuclease YbcO-like protein [Cupriavidus metallidurans]|jgi:hypothetical protein|uniref:nuclease domain-containing protein n=1 Tax=Cupriavidus TaxID=106589 RepID=UPI0004933CCE|nr:nuclease domain-containing protein [Cupriavidus metallidurans]MDE4918176.1 DUF1364 family protein [Cupriavidus metallidurans]
MTALVVVIANGKSARVNPLLHPDMLCHGQQCYLHFPGICRNNPDTVVPAHSNQLKHGKGKSIKANDLMTVPACFQCHYELDQGKRFSKGQKSLCWDEAYDRWAAYRLKMYGVPAARIEEAA